MSPHRRADAWVAGIGLLLLLGWDASGLDLQAARWFGGAQGFAWREHWLLSAVLHTGGRWLGLAVLGWLAVGLVWPAGVFKPLSLRLGRGQRLWWLLATLACAALVPAIKALTLTSCPWDLAEFGGAAQYVSHWRIGVRDGGGGHCFPSGHATSAFALLSGWFVLRGATPRAARIWLAAVVMLGLLFGGAQLLRGAHYPSHTLWTGWLCWSLCALLAHWLPPASASEPQPATP
jgi:membrane-associated PAP2 superfamily phosphatase